MSLNTKRNSYRSSSRDDKRLRTTYGLMNSWRSSAGFRPDSRSYNINAGLPEISRGSRAVSRIGSDLGSHSMPLHLSSYNRQSLGSEDFRNTFQRFQNKGMNPTFPLFGTPRMRYGRAGGNWRHVQEVTQAAGSNTAFVDGIPKVDDNNQIMYKDMEFSNVIQPKASCKAPIRMIADGPQRSRHRSPVYNSTYAVDNSRRFEKDNWMIVR